MRLFTSKKSQKPSTVIEVAKEGSLTAKNAKQPEQNIHDINKEKLIDPKAKMREVLGDSKKLAADCVFTAKEIKRIQKRFQAYMDPNLYCICNLTKLANMPEIKMNPFTERLIQCHVNKEHQMNVQQFIALLSVLSVKVNIDEKRGQLFRIYDVDGDGFVSVEDLYQIYSKCLLRSTPRQQVRNVCEHIITEHALENKGRGLSPNEFHQIVTDEEIDSFLTVEF